MRITDEILNYLKEVFEEFDKKSGTTRCEIDGIIYDTDWGYGLEGIANFIDLISRRNGFGQFNNRWVSNWRFYDA